MGLALRLSTTLSGWAAAANEPFLPPPAAVIPLRVATGAREVNATGCALIESFEGRHKRGPDGLIYPYHDHVGYPTQGVGRLLSREKWADLSHWAPIDDATCDAWLREDLDRFARGIERMCGRARLTDNEFAALVSWAFNVGTGNAQGSTLIRMLVRGDDRGEVADQLLRWNKADGKISKGLARRRAAERILFLTQ